MHRRDELQLIICPDKLFTCILYISPEQVYPHKWQILMMGHQSCKLLSKWLCSLVLVLSLKSNVHSLWSNSRGGIQSKNTKSEFRGTHNAAGSGRIYSTSNSKICHMLDRWKGFKISCCLIQTFVVPLNCLFEMKRHCYDRPLIQISMMSAKFHSLSLHSLPFLFPTFWQDDIITTIEQMFTLPQWSHKSFYHAVT